MVISDVKSATTSAISGEYFENLDWLQLKSENGHKLYRQIIVNESYQKSKGFFTPLYNRDITLNWSVLKECETQDQDKTVGYSSITRTTSILLDIQLISQ